MPLSDPNIYQENLQLLEELLANGSFSEDENRAFREFLADILKLMQNEDDKTVVSQILIASSEFLYSAHTLWHTNPEALHSFILMSSMCLFRTAHYIETMQEEAK